MRKFFTPITLLIVLLVLSASSAHARTLYYWNRPGGSGWVLPEGWEVINEELPDVQQRRPELSAAAALVVERATAKDPGKRYQEVWTSKRNDTVEREGLLTRVTGVMTGIRMEGIDDTRYGPPAPIDGQREVAYTLTARCAG